MATTCRGCGKPILSLKYMECCKCKYTYDLLCLRMDPATFEALSEESKIHWQCPSCSCARPKGNNSDTPIRSGVDNLNTTYTAGDNVNPIRGGYRKTKQSNDSEFSALFTEIRQLREEIQEIKQQNTELADKLTQKLELYEKKTTAQELELAYLRETVVQLQASVNSQEQYNLRNVLEISGIPESESENLQHIAMVVTKKIGVDLPESDIDEVSRAGPKRSTTSISPGQHTNSPLPRPIIVKVTSPFLVIELSLNRLEGTQLRALGLLNQFGFNVTYEVRGAGSPSPLDNRACSAIECRLLGHCYANSDFTDFYCSCFEGYSGSDCGRGPLCPQMANTCRNGGTCRQMGPAAVSCLCAPGYTGDICETHIASPECGIEECSDGCSENCDCHPLETDASSARFETRIDFADLPNNMTKELLYQIKQYLKEANITLEGDIEVLNVSSSLDGSSNKEVWLKIWGLRKDTAALKAALARLVASRARLAEAKVSPSPLFFEMHPAITLHGLTLNQRPEVWEGSEFIMSCLASGSSATSFAWYKDGVQINFSRTTRDIWTRTIVEDALGRRMGVLGVSSASKADAGQWSCLASDGGRRRCMALRLTVLSPPDLRIMPSTLTINKGENVSITCLAGASGRFHGALGFSWSRGTSLLPLIPGREVWEDLYPAGSLLRLYNVQKSAEYRCQVSSVAGASAQGVKVWALEPGRPACPASFAHGIQWPRTAPGTEAVTSCPPGYTGQATRFCEPETVERNVDWRTPNFSDCLADSLSGIFEQFLRISYGWSRKDLYEVLRQYDVVLESLPELPGGGTKPFQQSIHILDYLKSAASSAEDKRLCVMPLLNIFDTLLSHQDAFLDEQHIFQLQTALATTASLSDNLDIVFEQFSVRSSRIPPNGFSVVYFPSHNSPSWALASARLELAEAKSNGSMVTVLYHDLSAILPSLRKSKDYRPEGEMEYNLVSRHVQVATTGLAINSNGVEIQPSITLTFTHSMNYSAAGSWLWCGVRKVSAPGTWSTRDCERTLAALHQITCSCSHLGTYALMSVASTAISGAPSGWRTSVSVCAASGAVLALAAALAQLVVLVLAAHRPVLAAVLRAVTATSHAAALLALLHCDSAMVEGAGGVAGAAWCEWGGWWTAAWWSAGGAALCAQALLLHAELAGRGQQAASVALLAGVCVLGWLTARVWGDAPLRVGSAAQLACAAAAILLATLALVLAAAAAHLLADISRKLPADRKSFLKQRTGVIRHIFALLVLSSGSQATGVLYVQPGSQHTALDIAFAFFSLATGVALLVCYVVRDPECLRRLKQLFTLNFKKDPWETDYDGQTSLSLYIKQSAEEESTGAARAVMRTNREDLATTSYWRASQMESPAFLNRRQSYPDTRADIVRCVELKANGARYKAAPQDDDVTPTRGVCDLIPNSNRTEYMARVCVELGAANTPKREPLSCSVNFEPYNHTLIDSKENCTLCVKSNLDISKTSPPIKSCLKKTSRSSEMTSSLSLPSIEVSLSDDAKSKLSDLEQVNRDWNRAYNDSETTEKVLSKITSDLDFLLNRAQDEVPNDEVLDEIVEAPP